MSQTKAQLIDGKSAEIEFTGGSASGPAISFTGDSNTGIYSPGADQVAVATNGVGRLFVDASGRLGVGTASPSSLFHLSGNSGTAVFTLSDPANGMTGKLAADPTTLSLGTTTNHAVLCYTNSVERLRITSAGLVGIGTSSPSSTLHVAGPVTINNGDAINELTFAGTEFTNVYSATTSGFQLGTTGAGYLALFTSNTERARIDSSGRVGIGTSSVNSGSALHIARNTAGNTCVIRLSGNDGAGDGGAGIAFADNETVKWSIFTRRYSSNNRLYISTGENDANSSKVTITEGGSVGIGTTSPDQLLVVSQNAASYNPAIKISNPNTGRWGGKLIFESANGASVYDAAVIKADGGGGFGSGVLIVETAGSERCRVDGSGRLLVGTSSSTDDVRAVFQSNPTDSTLGGAIALSYTSNSPANGDWLSRIDCTDSSANVAARIIAARDGGTWTSGSSHPGRLVFSTTADGASSPTERMRITSGGYFKAAYDGNYLNASGAWHEFTGDAANGYDLRVTNDKVTPLSQYIFELRFVSSTPNNSNARFIDARDSTQGRFYVLSNGGIGNFQSNDSNLCDEREKKNIEALDSTWSCLKNWELKKFHYNDDDDTNDKRYGVIAQQVAPHCPEVITEWIKQRAEEAVLDDDGNVVNPAKEEIVRMGVKEQQMMWMAIKALQEAQTRIETLEAEVAALKAS